VLKLQQKGIYRLQTGAAQPHVYATDLQMLNIPIVSIDKQRDIVNHIADIRTKANALQAEGKAILEDAKRKVEQMIIGE
jgi:restriction endonuclease S subunit